MPKTESESVKKHLFISYIRPKYAYFKHRTTFYDTDNLSDI